MIQDLTENSSLSLFVRLNTFSAADKIILTENLISCKGGRMISIKLEVNIHGTIIFTNPTVQG